MIILNGVCTVAAPAGGATLTETANMSLWLKPETLSALSDGGVVTTWPDSSGNARDATQATANLKPLYKTNVLNGLSVVRFDIDDRMLSGLTISVAPYSIYVVYSYRSATSTGRRAINGSNNWLIGPYSNKYDSNAGVFGSGPAVTQNQFVIQHVVTQGTASVQSSVNRRNYFPSGTVLPGAIGLGAQGAITEPLDGDIAEVICYSVAHTKAQQETVTAYLGAKYGITLPTMPVGPASVDKGIVAWYKADAITGKVDGDAVSQWDDSSGNLHHATQSTGAAQPLYKPSVANSQPGVRFDATDDNLPLPVRLDAREYTVFIVYNTRQTPGGFRRALSGSNSWLMGPHNATQHQFFAGGYSGGPTVVQNQFRIPSVTFDVTNQTAHVGASTYGTCESTGVPGLLEVSPVERLGGDVLEIAFWVGALSSTDRDAVKNYLATKYGITVV